MVYTGIQGLEYLDTAEGHSALGLAVKNWMETLTSSTNTFAYLRSPIKSVIELPNKTATAYYDIMQIVGSANYIRGSVGIDRLNATTIGVNLDTPFIIAYELSELDDVRTANDFASKIQEITSAVWTKSFNAMFLAKLFTAIQTSYDATSNPNILELTTILNQGLTRDALDLMLETLTDKIDDVCKVYDKFGMGCDYSNFSAFCAPKVWNRFSRLIKMTDTETGVDAIRNGNNVMKLAGLPFFRDDMLNNKIDKTTSFSKDIDYDFTLALGVVSHSNIMGFPLKLLTPQAKLDDNFNINMGQKAIVGFQLFRPSKCFALTQNLASFLTAKFYQ